MCLITQITMKERIKIKFKWDNKNVLWVLKDQIDEQSQKEWRTLLTNPHPLYPTHNVKERASAVSILTIPIRRQLRLNFWHKRRFFSSLLY